MGITRGRIRHALAVVTVLTGILLATRPYAFALDPSLDVSQYAHTSWRIRDGFTTGIVTSFAQTPDGYLWLGTELGLVRFDGVRPVSWQLPAGQELPGSLITNLMTARDGTLWIGTFTGLASWKEGKLTKFPELAGLDITSVLEARDGTVWTSAYAEGAGRLCDISGGVVHCETLSTYGEALYEDSRGTLWVGLQNGFWRWKPGTPEFFSIPEDPFGITGFAEDEQGQLLFGSYVGIRRLVNGRVEAYPSSASVYRWPVTRMFRDHDRSLWIATSEHGVLSIHAQGRTEVFSHSDGLSGDYVTRFFEDREGSIWVATYDGVDRFREYPIPIISTKQGLSNVPWSILASKDGSVWIATNNALNYWKDGQIFLFGSRQGTQNSDGRLNRRAPTSLFEDSSGRIWVSNTTGEVGYLQADRFVSILGLPGGAVNSMAEVPPEHLWVSNQQNGLIHLFRGRVLQKVPWAGLGHKDHAKVMVADPSQRGLWLGFHQGGVAYYVDGAIRVYFSAANGLGAGPVSDLRFGSGGALWAATASGLSRIKDGRVITLTSKNGLPCDKVVASVEDNDHSMWLNLACGLARIAQADLDAWVADPNRVIKSTFFDPSDGVRTHAASGGFQPLMTKSADGKIWFLPWDGVSIIDPRHLPFNEVPPPVHIERIIADHKTYNATSDSNGQVSLPARIRDLQVDYTALSLVVPEKVLFRYKLEGWDRDWQDVGTRRQAFYSGLPPRNYRFRVMACNNSGVWNEAGASLDFSVAPAYYQTNWFRVSCGAAFLAFLWGLYQLRLRQLAREFNMRLDERVTERTRIARELHDSLLQNVQGLILKIHAIAKRIPTTDPTRQDIEKTLDFADQVLAEGRDRVRSLRSASVSDGDLSAAFQLVAEESSPDRTATFKAVVEGNVRALHPVVREESYSVGREAIINALTHSGGRYVEVEIIYDSQEFRLRIRDDGRGIDPGVLEKGGRADHWGLQGMRERASRIGAKLELWSRPGSGTEVELTVPGATAYRSPGGKSTDSGPRVSAAR